MTGRRIEERRAAFGEAAILSVRAAARLCPGRDADNLAAFEEAGIVYMWSGNRVVVWGDVMRVVRSDRDEIDRAPLPGQGERRRMVRAAGLPRPVDLGRGS